MKNFKKIALGLIAGAMAIGFSAFTNKTTTQKTGNFIAQWFKLKSGVAPTRANALVQENYEPAGSQPCADGAIYCGVFANNVSDQPDLNGTAAETAIEEYFDDDNETSIISARN